MIPIDFPQATKTLGPGGNENCGGLRVWTDGEHCISAWMPSEEDRAAILAGKPIFLWVRSGWTQCPVYLSPESPFQSDTLPEEDAAALRALGISS